MSDRTVSSKYFYDCTFFYHCDAMSDHTVSTKSTLASLYYSSLSTPTISTENCCIISSKLIVVRLLSGQNVPLSTTATVPLSTTAAVPLDNPTLSVSNSEYFCTLHHLDYNPLLDFVR